MKTLFILAILLSSTSTFASGVTITDGGAVHLSIRTFQFDFEACRKNMKGSVGIGYAKCTVTANVDTSNDVGSLTEVQYPKTSKGGYRVNIIPSGNQYELDFYRNPNPNSHNAELSTSDSDGRSALVEWKDYLNANPIVAKVLQVQK